MYKAFKGTTLEYAALHYRVKAKKHRVNACENCGIQGLRLDLANKSQKYLENITDWLWLCRPCHKRHDMTPTKRQQAISNLWWKTGKKRVPAKGEQVFLHKLTEAQVLKIRSLHHKRTYKELQEMFGIQKSNLHCILSRKTWKHI